jgi:3-isopropylmalate/(R)-2-methylmalate dehydratase small subunit
MEKFNVLTGIAAPFPRINVDTDLLVPKQYLRTIVRTGLGRIMFEEIRYTPDGKEIPDFVLNKEPYRHARILIAGDNFGCGSSREHAPWAILDFGIRAIVAPSFADIFRGNCFKNGILPIVQPQAVVDTLMKDAENTASATMSIDLPNQVIIRANGEKIPFEVGAFNKYCLVNGLDEIGLTLQDSAKIEAFEAKQRLSQPWLWTGDKA